MKIWSGAVWLTSGLIAGQVLVGHASSAIALQDADAVIRRADRALAALETLHAGFSHHVENPILEKTTEGEGILDYRAPSSYRIAYSKPIGDLVVNDGRFVWIYLPSSQPGQVIRQLASESGVHNPLTYLRDLRGYYDATLDGMEEIAGRRTHHLVLIPTDDRAPFAQLEVWVDQRSGLLQRVQTRTTQSVITTYTFLDMELNTTLEDDVFVFHLPPDTEIYDQ